MGMTEPLRIAIPIHSFEPGGVERVALNLAERWQQTGHQVSIVLGRDEGSDRGRVSAHLDYRIVSSRVPTARFETLWMIWCFFLHLSRERVDVIFCPGNTYAIVCVAARLLLGRVSEAHAAEDEQTTKCPLDRRTDYEVSPPWIVKVLSTD